MTGDRRLTGEEIIAFKLETPKRPFQALRIIVNSGDEPTLHDLAFIEIAARLEGMKAMIIELGREVKMLKEELSKRQLA